MDGDRLPDGRSLLELRVVDLKEELEKRGLSKSGAKAALQERLREALLLEKSHPSGGSVKAPAVAEPNPYVTEYLATQQRVLQAAREAANVARNAVASHDAAPSDLSAVEKPLQTAHVAQHPPADSSLKTDAAKAQSGNIVHENTMHSAHAGAKPKSDPMHSPPAVITPVVEAVPEEKKASGERRDSPRKQPQVSPTKDKSSVQQPDATKPVEKGGSRSAVLDPQVPLQNAVPVEPTAELREPLAERSSIVEKPATERQPTQGTDTVRTPAAPKSSVERQVRSTAPSPPERDNVLADDVLEDLAPGEQLLDDQKKEDDVVEDEARGTYAPRTKIVPLDDKPKEKPPRKRKWGSTTKAGNRNVVSISTDSLKEIIGEVTAADIGAASSSSFEDVRSEDHKSKVNGVESLGPRLAKRIVVARDESDDDEHQEPGLEIKPANVVREASEDTFVRDHSLSPSRNPPSNLICVRGLTRPFTVKALLDLLRRYGPVDDAGFWIDSVKSNCIVSYNSEEEATAARDNLHGIHWPSSNPRRLRVDFTTQDELDAKRGVVKEQPMVEEEERPKREPKKDSKEAKEMKKVEQHEPRARSRSAERREKQQRDDKKAKGSSPRARRHSRSPVKKDDKKLWGREREWDRGKNWRTGESPPRERRREQSPVKARVEEQPPAKLLDDLFRKTKAAPCIYWLPLTDEQYIMRLKERELRTEERRKLREEERGNHLRDSPPPQRRRSPVSDDRYRHRR